jgi:hypothetical protein
MVVQHVQSGLVGGINGNFLPVPTHPLEFDNTIDEGEECVIFAATDIAARVNFGAVLPVDNVTGFDRFTTEFLATKALTV